MTSCSTFLLFCLPPKKWPLYPRKSGHYTPEKVAIIPPKKWPLKNIKKSGINPTSASVYADSKKTFRLYKLFRLIKGTTAASRWSPPTPEKNQERKHRRGTREHIFCGFARWNLKIRDFSEGVEHYGVS